MFRRFPCDAYFEQDVDRPVVFDRFFLDHVQQFRRFHRMDHRDEWGDVFDFIGLQAADLMPSDVLRQGMVLLDEFLRAVFSESALPGPVGFQNG